jgi:hypothetical protein
VGCYKPLAAWRHADGEVYFGKERPDSRELELPCGKCIGCRTTRQRAWAIRILHESQMHEHNQFVTLTYDEEHYTPQLNYRHFQQFMKAVRHKNGPTRYFAVGEYGTQTRRPHFHAILFGLALQDGTPCGKNIKTSQELTKLWPHGFSSYGQVNYQSASYVAGYVLKKLSGTSDTADTKIGRKYAGVNLDTGEMIKLEPEMAHMSLKPGIGYTWFQKYWKEIYIARDGVVLKGGKQIPAPRYYDKLLELMASEIKETKDYERHIRAKQFEKENTTARLKVREQVAIARSLQRERTL